jgi:hypothetical protein
MVLGFVIVAWSYCLMVLGFVIVAWFYCLMVLGFCYQVDEWLN